MSDVLAVTDLRRSFEQGGETIHVLRGVDLSVARGEVVVIEGRIADRAGGVFVFDGGRNPYGVDAEFAKARGEIGEVGGPIIWIIVIPVIPPESLKDDLAVGGV